MKEETLVKMETILKKEIKSMESLAKMKEDLFE